MRFSLTNQLVISLFFFFFYQRGTEPRNGHTDGSFNAYISHTLFSFQNHSNDYNYVTNICKSLAFNLPSTPICRRKPLKGKSKAHLRKGQDGREGKQTHSSTLPSTSALGGVSGQRHAPADLSPGKTRYPFYRRLSGPHSRSGRVRKNSSQPGFDPRTVQPLASSYTDCAIPALKGLPLHTFTAVTIRRQARSEDLCLRVLKINNSIDTFLKLKNTNRFYFTKCLFCLGSTLS